MTHDTKKPTLIEAQISSTRMTRRGLFTAFGIAGGAVAVTALSTRGAMAGPTDSDSGSCADRAGHGRGGASSGLTDSDGGATCDPAGRGRQGSGWTDSDGGTVTDTAGSGRRGN